MAGVDHIMKKFRTLSFSSRRSRVSNIPYLPEGIIFNILVLLRAEILFNVMRYVCREWYNIINNPHFINAHLQRSTKLLLVQHDEHRKVIYIAETNNSNVRLRKLRYGFSTHILSTCDGLVLFRHDKNELLLCVANLITKHLLTLPPFLEPILYSNPTVLVYDPSVRRYKVVHLFRVNNHQYKCAILTVGSETAWRLIDTKPIPNTNPLFIDPALFAGGYLYWTSTANAATYLLAMDVEAEIMYQLPLPTFFNLSGDFLVRESVLTFIFGVTDYVWEAWALIDLKTGDWTSLFKVDLRGRRGARSRIPQRNLGWCNMFPIVWLKNGELVIFRSGNPYRNYIVYNIKTDEITSFTGGKYDVLSRNSHHAHVNSLVSLKGC
ncbi:putative F-box protein At3g16210 [Cornus florida]|uniref:putative F-box protein At3g16210 n=1 Tax=Cornus florida TaxID=4283 RepID=UPI00289E3646|nr:putative F-box protein At3g16210 [Cornus florida]XP_059651725.1 putative F-box protein At3g16210 [Cornus florida]